MTTNRMQGQCLCGAVTISAETNTHVDACHCGMCRRWGGGPLLAVSCGSNVQIEGKENVSIYDSSEWAERGFCRHCGTHLFYRFKSADAYAVPAGLFQDQEQLALAEQIYIDSKPAYYAFANVTPLLTEAEVLRRFGME